MAALFLVYEFDSALLIVYGVKTGGDGAARDLKSRIHIWDDTHPYHELLLVSVGG